MRAVSIDGIGTTSRNCWRSRAHGLLSDGEDAFIRAFFS